MLNEPEFLFSYSFLDIRLWTLDQTKPLPPYTWHYLFTYMPLDLLSSSLLDQVTANDFLAKVPHLLLGYLVFSSWRRFANLERGDKILSLKF